MLSLKPSRDRVHSGVERGIKIYKCSHEHLDIRPLASVESHTSAPSNILHLSDRVPERVGGEKLKILLMRTKADVQKDEKQKQEGKPPIYIGLDL